MCTRTWVRTTTAWFVFTSLAIAPFAGAFPWLYANARWVWAVVFVGSAAVLASGLFDRFGPAEPAPDVITDELAALLPLARTGGPR